MWAGCLVGQTLGLRGSLGPALRTKNQISWQLQQADKFNAVLSDTLIFYACYITCMAHTAKWQII